jgi:hypothetical protein
MTSRPPDTWGMTACCTAVGWRMPSVRHVAARNGATPMLSHVTSSRPAATGPTTSSPSACSTSTAAAAAAADADAATGRLLAPPAGASATRFVPLPENNLKPSCNAYTAHSESTHGPRGGSAERSQTITTIKIRAEAVRRSSCSSCTGTACGEVVPALLLFLFYALWTRYCEKPSKTSFAGSGAATGCGGGGLTGTSPSFSCSSCGAHTETGRGTQSQRRRQRHRQCNNNEIEKRQRKPSACSPSSSSPLE